jgi:hypothetical protein
MFTPSNPNVPHRYFATKTKNLTTHNQNHFFLSFFCINSHGSRHHHLKSLFPLFLSLSLLKPILPWQAPPATNITFTVKNQKKKTKANPIGRERLGGRERNRNRKRISRADKEGERLISAFAVREKKGLTGVGGRGVTWVFFLSLTFSLFFSIFFFNLQIRLLTLLQIWVFFFFLRSGR